MLKKILIVIVGFVIGIGVILTANSFWQSNEIVENSNEVVSDDDVILGEGYEDWTEETHSKEADPDYDTVFPQEEVNRLDIVIAEEDWQIMMDNMDKLYGDSSERGTKGGDMPLEGLPPTNLPQDGDIEAEMMLPPGGRMRPMDGEMMPEDRVRPEEGEVGQVDKENGQGFGDEKPVFVESQLFFNGTQWYNIGIRFKGNSSLRSAWQSGILKLPFKIDFDEFEDDYEELKNQRFYGFKELSMSSNFQDTSFLSEKLAAESFDAAGITAPATAFYQMYIDYGEGPVYFGLYTAVEVIDDTVIDSDFDDNDGNLYKAIGAATSFADEKSDSLKTAFEKKTNEDDDDWSDLEGLLTIINSDARGTDYDAWKSDLEEVFDADVFLNWLAVNTVIQNWDTYGNMSHNYYLYNNPDTDQLTWIPWDNNEAFVSGKKNPLSLTFNEIGENWPLIRYLMDDEEYREIYISYINEFLENTLDTDEFKERVVSLHDLIEPYVVGDDGEKGSYTFLKNDDDFAKSLETLMTHIEERIELASEVSLDSDWEYDETLGQKNDTGMRGMRP